jgi:hypothetical protein
MPTKKLRPRKNTKLTGERSEAAFLNRAAGLGFGVAKPWGDSLRYDFILDNGSRLWRVQVKCTESIRARAYETRATYSVGSGRAVYTRADIDFLAAHVVPLDIWYILPVEVCTPAPMLRFYPHRTAKKMRLEPYREAWHLLQSADSKEADSKAAGLRERQATEKDDDAHPHRVPQIHAVADETVYPDTVILSEDADSLRGSAPQSRDPYLQQSTGEVRAAGTPVRLTWLTPRPTQPVIIAT